MQRRMCTCSFMSRSPFTSLLGCNTRAPASLSISNEHVLSRSPLRRCCCRSFAVYSENSREDAKDVPPLPLPRVSREKYVTLVRHGQSTWNAQSIIQGSTDESQLTEKGIAQAQQTHAALLSMPFDELFHSPLRRASHTASIVWGSRPGKVTCLPSLREIDLYSLEGCHKENIPQEHLLDWKEYPASFEIDGHAPVRELWYRASLIWQALLGNDDAHLSVSDNLLIVAHNAVNQALLCTALGVPPTAFRKLAQSNGAYSQVLFSPGQSHATLLRLNQGVLNQGPLSLKNATVMVCGPNMPPEICQSVISEKSVFPGGAFAMEPGNLTVVSEDGVIVCTNNSIH